MFRRLNPIKERSVEFSFDGQEITAEPDDTVASALLAAGILTLRSTPVSESERGPFCMMGACFDCLVDIDGVTLQACAVPVSHGLCVQRVRRSGPAGADPS